MDDLTQFLNSVESSARKILKKQNKKQQEQAVRDRVALAKGSPQRIDGSQSISKQNVATREELRATYTSSGSLIISAPPPPAVSNQQQPTRFPRSPSRSEDPIESPEDGALPRLPPPRSPVASVPPGSLYSPLQLPSIDRKRRPAPGSNGSPGKRSSSLKLLESPLYKSLIKARADQGGFGVPGATPPGQKLKKALHDVDKVALLLRKMGLHDSTGVRSPAHRTDHAVDKRMCNACWANPDKMSGCEHHPRVYPNGSFAKRIEGDAVEMLKSMELQGPTSWLSDDLFVKYRSEKDRETLWSAFVELKRQQQEIEERGSSGSGATAKEQASLAVIPIVTRHPVCALFTTLQELENLRTQAETRKRNLTKTFIFDVNHIWLTNLDHFNHHCTTQLESNQHDLENHSETMNPELRSLSGRRDEKAIREGYSQIQSISTSRALQHAVSIGGGPSKQIKMSMNGSQAVNTLTANTRRRKPPSRGGNAFRPLSLLVCGKWDPGNRPNILDRVLGATLVGTGPVLWWRYDPDHEHPDELIQQPEYTKALALFARNNVLSSSNSILVSLVLALDTPILSPLWFAWHVGSKMPPPELEAAMSTLAEVETGFGRVVALVSSCLEALLSTRLTSILDELLPGTIALLNDVAQDEDHWLNLVELSSTSVGHRRGWTEFSDRHNFRQWLLLRGGLSLTPRFDVEAQYCSVTTAHANAPGVGGRYCWHETDPITKLLCRRRVEKDMLYLIQNHLTSGPNDPSYFSVVMAHETMVEVKSARLATYLAMVAEREARAAYEKKMYEIEQKLEAGRLALEAKRQEQKRLEAELESAAAKAEIRHKGGVKSSQEEAIEQEWAQRLKSSTVLEQQGLWELRELTIDSSGVVFYHSLNRGLPVSYRFLWEPPAEWQQALKDDTDDTSGTEPPLTDRSIDSSASKTSTTSATSSGVSSITAKHRVNAKAQSELINSLLGDEQFLKRLKTKLGLSAQSRPGTGRPGRPTDNDEGDESDPERLDWADEMAALQEEGMDRSKAALVAAKMARLELSKPKATANRHGEGWKRLKTCRLPANFARNVYKSHTEGPRSSFINETNHATPVGMLDPADCSPYDPPEFIPELRAHFVPRPAEDLADKKRQWAEFERNRHLETPNNVVRRGAVSVPEEMTDEMFERDPNQKDESKEQREAKAILCSRNNNIEGLELALDQGVDVNTRDNHGNTLFILVCQQGNKRLAKFLLRRRADMNLQNLNGNTALHYLYAYKHKDLAEYLKSKGAKDTTQNNAGLTCYEGLSQDQVDNI